MAFINEESMLLFEERYQPVQPEGNEQNMNKECQLILPK